MLSETEIIYEIIIRGAKPGSYTSRGKRIWYAQQFEKEGVDDVQLDLKSPIENTKDLMQSEALLIELTKDGEVDDEDELERLETRLKLLLKSIRRVDVTGLDEKLNC